jgi:metal-sulfur cluster biosynthetic enzyme
MGVKMDEPKLESQVKEQVDHTNNETPSEDGVIEGLPKSMPIVEPGSPEEQIKTALRQVYDPEIGLEVIQLGLIREIQLAPDPAEVKMILTTPFCPYGGWLIQQIKDISESVSGRSVKVTVMPDLWDPTYMEDPGLLLGW